MMNTHSLHEPTTIAVKEMSGDGDGIKQINGIRNPIPSSRKFTPIPKNTKDMKAKLEMALKETKTSHKKQGLRTTARIECSSVDKPVRITNKKYLKSAAPEDKIKIYCSPRKSIPEAKFPQDAGRLIFKYLLLNSWRKCRSRYNDLKSSILFKENKIKHLNMQVEVLKNLRKSESQRREEIFIKYHEIKREYDNIIQQNSDLRNHVECLEKDKICFISELERLNERTSCYKQEIEEKTNLLNAHQIKIQREKEKVKKIIAERKQTQEQYNKLESVINIQRENLQNLKSCVDTLQKSNLNLNCKLETHQEACKIHSEELRTLTSENAENKSKITTYETEKEEMSRDLSSLRKQLKIALNNCDDFKNANESIQLEMLEMSRKLQAERYFLWNLMSKGVNTTYTVMKYLAEKIVPAVQTHFTY
ncbi:kinesin-related protein 4-like [Coccinella septempunctata]|uniref:kinesin-related protein 4-like n=1 Tax=Coccinella septempunctata TaxID=41139 RepID=UPI001D084D95|nr:kinesin-related protein 4-like [Coccinella septempunctata]